jgi:hypothetical protein
LQAGDIYWLDVGCALEDPVDGRRTARRGCMAQDSIVGPKASCVVVAAIYFGVRVGKTSGRPVLLALAPGRHDWGIRLEFRSAFRGAAARR